MILERLAAAKLREQFQLYFFHHLRSRTGFPCVFHLHHTSLKKVYDGIVYLTYDRSLDFCLSRTGST